VVRESAVGSPVRQAQGPERVEGLALAATAQPRFLPVRRKTVFAVGTAWIWLGASVVFGALCAFSTNASGQSTSIVANQPMGEAKGVFPGRVVWVHDPNAVNQNCVPNVAGHGWYLPENNNQTVIDGMVSTALRDLTGKTNDLAAWTAIFQYHNAALGKGAVSYAPGEKIFIKINATSAWDGNFNTTDLTPNADPTSPYSFITETSVGPVLTVLRQLVNVVGVAQSNIYVGDPLKHIYKHLYDVWHGEFPNVHYLDNGGYTQLGRENVVPSTTATISYSDRGTILRTDPGDATVTLDHLYTISDEADYVINIPMLKGHKRAGMTIFAKNNFGSQTRVDASHLHNGLVAPAEMPPNAPQNAPRGGYGLYRVQVDLMSHSMLGKKNLVFLMDALWATDFELDLPLKWQMPPFNNSYMSSVFASLDPVAIESVGYDFLRSEFTATRVPAAGTYVQMPGVDDYLHQAADSANWPSGIVYDPNNTGTPIGSLGAHEHWNNATAMQYSRNLAPTGAGIELVQTGQTIGVGPISNRAVLPGGNATFTVTATGMGPLSYQWQREAIGSSTWTNLSDGGTYSGSATATLTVGSATTAMNGDLFRCLITNADAAVTTSPIALAVETPMVVTTLAGLAGSSGSAVGAGSAARFNSPADIARDSTGNVYVADTDNNTVRMIIPAGVVTTLAGQAGVSGSNDGSGSALFNHPAGIAVDGAGNAYVADTNNNTIRKLVIASGAVTTVTGRVGIAGSTDGIGTAASFNGPSGIAVDTAGNLYVADTLNHAIRQVTPAGVVTTIAGTAGASGFIDGTGSAALFHGPQGLVLDASGNLFIADTNNNAVRKLVLASGAVTTAAGQTGIAGSADGPSSQAQFHFPSGIGIDAAGNLYVADTDNDTLRKIALSGAVSTLAGLAGTSGSADGTGTAARFNFPTGVAANSTGDIYLADTNNHTIRLCVVPAAPSITTQPQSQTVTAGANVTFSVTATGKPAPTYQWLFDGTAISGATSSTLTLNNVQPASAGYYSVLVTNSTRSLTSDQATLTVNSAGGGSSGGSGGGGGGGGGGGAPSLWFCSVLLLLAAARRTFRRQP
jgi:sugar lactone lactonase YvrE